MMDISVVIPCYNQYIQLLKVLEGLSRQTFPKKDFEVILIDDGSDIVLSSYDAVTQFNYILNLKIVRNMHSGRSAARNKGIEHADGGLLVFLDSDMILPDNYLERHYNYHVKQDKIFVHSCVLDDYFYYFSEKGFTSESTESSKTMKKLHRLKKELIKIPLVETLCRLIYENKVRQLDWAGFIAGNVSIVKQSIESAGMFSDQFSGWGCEDFELGYRLHLQGYRLIYDDLTLMHVPHALRSEESIKRSFRQFYSMYNDSRIELVEQFLLGRSCFGELMDDLCKLNRKDGVLWN